MNEARRANLPLILGAVAFSIAIGVVVFLRAPEGSSLRRGSEPPDLVLRDLEGESVSLDDFGGRVVFVNFWASWCAPCREEAPPLERLYRELRDDGFVVLAVSVDAPGDRGAIDAFQRDYELSFPILHDPEKRAYRAFGVTGLPETFLIDAEGRIAEHYVGPRDWSQPRYARRIRRMLEARESSDG